MTVASAPQLRRAGLVIAVLGLTAIAFLTLLPEPPAAVRSHLCLACGAFGGVNGILNVLLFVPLGVGLALCGFPGKRTVFVVLVISATIEVAQLAIPGRYSSLGDVLTNAIGGALGFAAARYARTWLLPSPRFAMRLVLSWCAIWLAVQAATSFAFTPSVPDSRYYGQIARTLAHFAVFPGRVLAASIDNVSITDTPLSDADSVGRRLRNGGTVAATVVAAGLTKNVAPIVRIADAKQREIVLLAQDGQHLLFGLRTGAAILRLRPPLFGMTGVFQDGVSTKTSSLTDTLSLTARYDGHEAELTARTGSAVQKEHRLPISSSLGWTLMLPFQWFIEDTRAELILSWIWMACLMVPIGYWRARGGRISTSQASGAPRILWFLGGVAVLLAGFVLIPRALGLSEAPIRDWLAAASGIIAGGALAARTRESSTAAAG